ncbi:hypothetical protein QRX50_07910 [Amycolatopsis carbonis]|uniref:ABC transporter n=1 Tax=Amycolatopsis carbonis TaxID=715471 RepID=A0A9Y2MW28_9PSEU|nr:hypothetical protein [Amycolatopsis sp. 2-15]WIX80681.1 hypothetical protein QRX50_07910 [Amycolatopsis sp. 2-15]
MLAVSRYYLALLGHSQRYLPAVLAYLALSVILYSDPHSPVLPLYGVSSGALVVLGCWLTIAVLDIEDPVQRLVTLSHARSRLRTIGGAVLAVFGCLVVLTVITIVWSAIRTWQLNWGAFAVGVLALPASGLLGIAIGLPCSRLLVGRIGWTVLAAVLVLGLVLLGKWVPLVHPLITALTNDAPYGGALVLAVVTSVVALGVSAGVVGWLAGRRA